MANMRSNGVCWRTALPAQFNSFTYIAIAPGADVAQMRNWLREPGSLTARLKHYGRFRVEVLHQMLALANADECVALGISQNRLCWVREVVLYCDNHAVIYAHTVLPTVPRGVLIRWFARLGTRSLGSLLFVHRKFVRGDLNFCQIDKRHPFFKLAAEFADGLSPRSFLARRCLHRYGRQAVLVSEVFLPNIARLKRP